MSIRVRRKCMYTQAERYKVRLKGIKEMVELLHRSQLIPSTKYALLNSWQGILRYSGAIGRTNLPPYSANMMVQITWR